MRRVSGDQSTDEIPVMTAGRVETSRPGRPETPDDFAAFYGDHHERIERALALTLGDVETARDAAAEGFARALLRWRQVETLSNPAGWVYRTGLNWARSRWRRRRREVTPLSRVQPTALDGTDEAGQVVDEMFVAGLLGALSVDQRCVLIARFYLGWSEQETAHALDIAPGTVKSRSARARSELAAALRRNSLEDER